jgi:8-oxo-dGTP diphosphatase
MLICQTAKPIIETDVIAPRKYYNGSIMVQVAAAVIFHEGKILIARRKQGLTLSGKWEFPGGKLEENETMVQCLNRELREELGIEVAVEEFILANKYTYNFGDVELFVFKARFVSGDLTLQDHSEIKWVLPSELLNYDFPEATIPICRQIAGADSSQSG